ncbi:MAG TPA: hypothetical protein VN874_02340 [Myxococcales bacterium]|nr:hypothetical protein [Myxococcales bacterium]
MKARLSAVLVLACMACGHAGLRASDGSWAWVEVRTRHFVVRSDCPEEKARSTALQLAVGSSSLRPSL